jgi:hypothetical protein
MITVTEPQLRAALPSAIRYKQVLLVYGTDTQQLKNICGDYDGVEVIEPFSPVPSHDQQVTLVRLFRPTQREQAMVIPYWPDIPKPLLTRVTQYRLTK